MAGIVSSRSGPFSGRNVTPTNENAGRLATGVAVWSEKSLLQGSDADAIARPGALVGADHLGPLLAVADGFDAIGRNALRDQILAHRIGPALAERKIVLAGAALVALAFDGDRIV